MDARAKTRDMLPHFGHFEPRCAPPPPCELLLRIGTWRAVASAGASALAVSRGVPKRRAHVERQRVRERTWCIVVV